MHDFQLVIFDWAGTLIDFGCQAPLVAFHEAFANAGLPISEAIARQPTGAHKRDHVREILGYEAIAARVRQELGREPDDTLIDEIYADFSERLPALLPQHAEPIPGVVEALQWLRAEGLRVGSTTGYMRSMMNVLEPVARAAGVEPEVVVCADEVPQSRPAPWACFRAAEALGVYPMSRALKVGDTPADMAEGRNAGMFCIGISETGNELGLSLARLEALEARERTALERAASDRLTQAGAHVVLRTVAELPMWLTSFAE